MATTTEVGHASIVKMRGDVSNLSRINGDVQISGMVRFSQTHILMLVAALPPFLLALGFTRIRL